MENNTEFEILLFIDMIILILFKIQDVVSLNHFFLTSLSDKSTAFTLDSNNVEICQKMGKKCHKPFPQSRARQVWPQMDLFSVLSFSLKVLH